jgi:hypothetical protein
VAIRDIGPLIGADEGLNHQIVDTFATVAESDYSWTEKLWVSIARTDGSVQLDLGLGKYHNRGIIDGFGGVSRGREQWTVRGSHELRSAPEETAVGPIVYDVVDPLQAVRVRLERSDVQPISFDVVLSGVTPPFFEERNLVRNRRTQRVDVNVIPITRAAGPRARSPPTARPSSSTARTRSGSVTTRGASGRAWASPPATSSARRRPLTGAPAPAPGS